MRRLVERLTGRLVYRRRLPAQFGRAPLYVGPAGGLAYLFKPLAAIDPSLLRLADELVQPGHVVWDVGANLGLFAVPAAVRAGSGGKVYAFEPDIWLAQSLRRTARIQDTSCAPITVVPAAVASDISLRSFLIARRARASNALDGYGRSQIGGVAERQTVPAFNLDWLLTQLPAPDLLKIDVEGAEAEVLRGQTQMLDRVRPTIVCEVGSNARAELSKLFEQAHYRMYDGGKPLPDQPPMAEAAWSTVAIPRERTPVAHQDHAAAAAILA